MKLCKELERKVDTALKGWLNAIEKVNGDHMIQVNLDFVRSLP